mgnify:CR=1 FL=1
MNVITNELTKSPIFNLSLCSLENFHTSFITWVGNEYPKEFITIFSNKDYSKADSIQFKTQVNCGQSIKLDLQIVINNGQTTEYIIVENKLKSFPTDEQLNKYTDYFKNEKASFILLSLAPKFDLPNQWSYISYDLLAKKMNALFNDNFHYKEQYHKFIIEDYINVIKNLSEKFPKEITLKYDFYEERKLDELQDIYIKYRTSEFKDYICKNSSSCNVFCDTDFSNKQGIVNIWWKSLDEFDIPIKILIQIQKTQYRYCMVFNCNISKDLQEKIANDLYINGYWFMHTTPTARGKIYKEFCGYNPNFIYRYMNIDDGFGKKLGDVTYKEFSEQIQKDILALENNKDKIAEILTKWL